MLDKVPNELWSSVHKVFEPCVGKGGYLMPSLDWDGIYNISDNIIYLLINYIKEFNGVNIWLKLL